MRSDFKHSFKEAARAELALTVYNTGFQKCAPKHGWGPGVRDHFLIHYVVSGRGILQTENKTFVLQAGDAFLIKPETSVFYEADAEEPWSYYWVGFAGTGARLFLNQTVFKQDLPVVFLRQGERFRLALLEIYKARGSDYPSAVRMSGYLQAALGLLMTDAPSEEAETPAVYARRGAEFIQQNYSLPITVTEVAEQIGVSRSYLYRVFMMKYSCSPSDYLTDCRISRACHLLRHSDLPVAAVAASVGFEDSYYFSRAFRREIGQTPSAYRDGK